MTKRELSVGIGRAYSFALHFSIFKAKFDRNTTAVSMVENLSIISGSTDQDKLLTSGLRLCEAISRPACRPFSVNSLFEKLCTSSCHLNRVFMGVLD